MRAVDFYKTADGKCPVKDFLRTLPIAVQTKIAKVLEIVQNMATVPVTYFKHLSGTEFYECRITFGGSSYRLLGFFYGERLIILTNGFMKKTQKTPKKEIKLCEQRKKDFLLRGGE